MDRPAKWNVLVDGDTLVYKCAFVAEKRMYRLMYNGVAAYEAKLKSDIKKFLATYDGPDLVEVKETWVEPLSYSIQACKTTLMALQAALAPYDEFRVFLSDPDTPDFRVTGATIKPYKGNRVEMTKPVYYHQLREYMFEYWGAELVSGMEADDMLGIEQNDNSVIVTMDKDLYQVPGWHYNWTDAEPPFYIPQHEADRWKWVQCLCGDSTDNIEGIPGLGSAGAIKLLQNVEDELLEEAVRDIYEDYFSSTKKVRGKPYSLADYAEQLGMTAHEIMEENLMLVTILQERPDVSPASA